MHPTSARRRPAAAILLLSLALAVVAGALAIPPALASPASPGAPAGEEPDPAEPEKFADVSGARPGPTGQDDVEDDDPADTDEPRPTGDEDHPSGTPSDPDDDSGNPASESPDELFGTDVETWLDALLARLAGEPTTATYVYDPWAPVRQCESNGNYAINTGNGYYGAYQFSISTWNAVAAIVLPSYVGVRPDLAPSWVQDRVAQALAFEVAGGGLHHWPVCGRLYGS